MHLRPCRDLLLRHSSNFGARHRLPHLPYRLPHLPLLFSSDIQTPRNTGPENLIESIVLPFDVSKIDKKILPDKWLNVYTQIFNTTCSTSSTFPTMYGKYGKSYLQKMLVFTPPYRHFFLGKSKAMQGCCRRHSFAKSTADLLLVKSNSISCPEEGISNFIFFFYHMTVKLIR